MIKRAPSVPFFVFETTDWYELSHRIGEFNSLRDLELTRSRTIQLIIDNGLLRVIFFGERITGISIRGIIDTKSKQEFILTVFYVFSVFRKIRGLVLEE